ncbi:MAG: hypothetical protein NZ561_05505, partial [Phycisphaerae bacterium]|nr:hypothetical protein [Phycisphaerae bacterium]
EGSTLRPRRLILVPEGTLIEAPGTGWLDQIRDLPPGSLDSGPFVEAAIADGLRRWGEPVVVVTDQSLEVTDRRGLIVAPVEALENLGIMHVAANHRGRPQVLVRVANQQKTAISAVVSVATGAETHRRPVELSPGAETDIFVDLNDPGDTISVALDPVDGLAADHRAWLVRSAAWPTLEPIGPLPAELDRMVQAYAAHRPTGDGCPAVAVVANPEPLKPDRLAVIYAGLGSDVVGDMLTSGSVEVSSALGREVDWPALLKGARIGAEPDDSWTALVRAAGKTLLAERASPAKQILVNFRSPAAGRDPAFVVLFTNIFDSFAKSEGQWRAEKIFTPPAGWRRLTDRLSNLQPSPGVYVDSAGTKRALNALGIRASATGEVQWEGMVRFLPRDKSGARDLTPAAAAIAVGLLLVSGMARAAVGREG